MTKKSKVITRISIFILTLFWMSFIISNSLQSGAESGVASAGVTRFINDILLSLGIKKPLSEGFIRNMAHFTEFGILSLLACFNILFSEKLSSQRLPLSCALLSLSVPFCALFALLDEFVQRFSDGRASDITDVLTDTCGAVLATALFIGIYCLSVNIKYRKRIQKND